jgi:hypothetical protein
VRTIITSKTKKGEEALQKLSKEKFSYSFRLFFATKKVLKKNPFTLEINNKALRKTFKISRIPIEKIKDNPQYLDMVINHTMKNVLSKYGGTKSDFNIEVKK